MKYYIHFLSTKTPDSSPAFIVHFDSQRYLFNCSEGTQRLINENKIHLGKIKNLFFTRSIWGNIGGLPGMVLTLADAGTKEFGIHGPQNLIKCFVGSRNFLQRSQVNFRVHEFLSSNEKYVDENLIIIPVPVYSSKSSVESKSKNETTSTSTSTSSTSTSTTSVNNNKNDNTTNTNTNTNEVANRCHEFERKIPVIDNLIHPNELNKKILKSMFSCKGSGTLKTSKIFKNGVPIPYTSEVMETTTTPENDNKRKKSYESSSRSSGDDDDDDVNEEEDENSILKSNDSNDSMELPSPPALEKMKKIKKMNGNNDRGTDSNNENNDNNLNNYKKEKVKDKDKVKDKEKKGEKEVEKEEKEFNIEDRNVRIKQPVNQDYSLCYICQGHPVPGKFDPQKAKALGVIPGKQFGLLSKGECVTTPNGKVVRPEQVKESDRISSIFIVIDCPSLDHIPSLIHQKSFQNPKVLRYTKNIIHILGDPAILKNSSYQSWMKQFSEDCNHIIVSSNYCSEHINFLSNSYMQYKLHQVDSQAFPLLYFSNEIKESLKSNTDLPKNIISACNNLQVHIEPKEHLDYSKVKENFNFQSIPIKITDKLKNNAESIHYLKSNIDHWRQEHPFSTFSEATDIEIVTLGTGSALPSKYRNVSSTIILSKRNGNILLDAGEGTFGQISRHFGPEKTLHDILPRIKMIFVSHIHADHHLGMMNLLSVMASLHRTSDNPLYIIAPEKFNIWLEEYSVIQDIGLNTFIKVVPSYLLFNKFIDKYTSYSEILDYLNMSNIETIPVMHVRGACAIVFDFKDCSLEHVSS
jgi:ribonuclease BN (tRNA processing enzyme)